MSKTNLEQEWVKKISDKLVGKTIKEVRYISDKEARGMYWDARSVAIQLSDGEWVFPMQDDEGNGPGALSTTYEDLPTIPVFS
jgi:hypothetical protein|tara:strand:- start:1324 stop:1572 length:249 start_codon:yes stop_codon:yes gene_type:complete